jgi:hypothetical protein
VKKQIDDAIPIKIFLTARMERNLCPSPAALMQINSHWQIVQQPNESKDFARDAEYLLRVDERYDSI